jgi:hypothetical protein
MESLKSLTNYVYESTKYVVNETWQLGADAGTEAYNIASELYSKPEKNLIYL